MRENRSRSRRSHRQRVGKVRLYAILFPCVNVPWGLAETPKENPEGVSMILFILLMAIISVRAVREY